MQRNLQEWLEFIDQIHSKKIDMSLQRVTQVARAMELFPFTPFCITVAGTNGKGTTVSFIEKVLTHSGYHVGAMTSPHLLRFNERLRINTNEISDESICQAFEKINHARKHITLSYFEFVTLAGLYLFKMAEVDIAILEVGMGGRLDAVNIIDTDLAIITNIALDHVDYLGSDRESIGREKAGILRPNIPVIYGELDIPNSVNEIINKNNNQLFQFGKDYASHNRQNLQLLNLPQHATTPDMFITSENLLSVIPFANAANAIKALEIIQTQFPVDQTVIINTLKNFSLIGRWQVIKKPFIHIFDVAHNPHGIIALKNFLQRYPCEGKTHAIFSMLRSKDFRESLAMIKDIIDYWYIAPLKHELALSKIELELQFTEPYKSFENIPAAYRYTQSHVTQNDRLVIFGSFHTVAEVWQLTV